LKPPTAFPPIILTVDSLIDGNYAAAAVMISFGAVIGKATPLQLFLMTLIEIPFYSVNYFIGIMVLKFIDNGGSVIIHLFGSCFGLAVSFFLSRNDKLYKQKGNTWTGTRHSSHGTSKIGAVVSVIGTVFLWVMWPSFNAVFVKFYYNYLKVPFSLQQRVILNTVLCLTASTITTFFWSKLYNDQGKFNMINDIQRATISGGVAISCAANLTVGPVGAIAIGIVTSIFSTFGYHVIQPVLLALFWLHDTCGINNLHGIPGMIGGLAGVVTSGISWNSTVVGNDGVVSSQFFYLQYQWLIHFAVIAITLLISITTGLITGLILRWIIQEQKPYEDFEHWDDCEDDYKMIKNEEVDLEEENNHEGQENVEEEVAKNDGKFSILGNAFNEVFKPKETNNGNNIKLDLPKNAKKFNITVDLS
jgi:ammonium transporter Rh